MSASTELSAFSSEHKRPKLPPSGPTSFHLTASSSQACTSACESSSVPDGFTAGAVLSCSAGWGAASCRRHTEHPGPTSSSGLPLPRKPLLWSKAWSSTQRLAVDNAMESVACSQQWASSTPARRAASKVCRRPSAASSTASLPEPSSGKTLALIAGAPDCGLPKTSCTALSTAPTRCTQASSAGRRSKCTERSRTFSNSSLARSKAGMAGSVDELETVACGTSGIAASTSATVRRSPSTPAAAVLHSTASAMECCRRSTSALHRLATGSSNSAEQAV